MENVDARTGPFRKNGGAAHGLDCDHRGPRGKVRERIEAPRIAHARLAPLHDGIGLCVQRDPFAGAGDDLEGLEHRAGRWARNLSEGVAHIELEADHAAVDQRRHMLDRVLAEEPVEAEIDVRAGGRDAVLVRQHVGRAGRRNGVGHVEHGGDAAECRGGRTGLKVLLVRIAGVAEMHMHIDRARQDMEPLRVQHLARRRHRLVRADDHDHAVLDRNAGIDDGIRRHDLAAADNKIG